MTENELRHHGIIGQKWGVRRFQNPDGSLTPAGMKRYKVSKTDSATINKDDIVIKRGSINSHVTTRSKFKVRKDVPLYMYDPNDKHDTDVYEGAFSKYINDYKNKDRNPVKIYDFINTVDIRMPSSKQQRKEFGELMSTLDSKKRNEVINELNKTISQVKDMKRYYESYGVNLSPWLQKIASYDALTENTSSKTFEKAGYDTYMNMMEYRNYQNGAKYVSKLFESQLMKKGYNAMLDDNNAKVYNDAIKPYIVLNPDKTLKQFNITVNPVTDIEDHIKNLRDYNDKKYGVGKKGVSL